MADRKPDANRNGRGNSNRGFASMTPNAQREIARMGGAAVSENREHMAAIGRKGGEASAESRAAAASLRAEGGKKEVTGNASAKVSSAVNSSDTVPNGLRTIESLRRGNDVDNVV